MAIARDTEIYGRHPQKGCLGMWSGPHDLDGEVRGCSVGCTIGVSDISASRVLQPRRGSSGVSRTKKKKIKRECCTRCGDISGFFNVGQARPSVRVRSFRMRFTLGDTSTPAHRSQLATAKVCTEQHQMAVAPSRQSYRTQLNDRV